MNRLTEENGSLKGVLGSMTQWIEDSREVGELVDNALLKLAAYEATGLEPEEIKQAYDMYLEGYSKLSEYADLMRKGLLIKLPCRIGTKIFATKRTTTYIGTVGKKERYSVEEMFLNEDNLLSVIDAWNESVFLTREEAEKALEGMK